MIFRDSTTGQFSATTRRRLEKASTQMVKDARLLTERKGQLDQALVDLRIQQSDAPVRTVKKK